VPESVREEFESRVVEPCRRAAVGLVG